MTNEWQKYLEMATGLTQVTKQRAEAVVRSLVRQGEVASDRAERTVDDLLQRSEKNRKAVAAIIRSETERAVETIGVVRQREFDRLSRQVNRLEEAVRGGGRKAAQTVEPAAKKTSASAAKKAAATPAAKKAAATPAAKKAAKAASATKAAKKAAGKKATKSAAAKTAAAKATTKKAAGKKASAKKATKKASPQAGASVAPAAPPVEPESPPAP